MKEQKQTYLYLKDYAVTGEEFKLVYNANLDMLETLPETSEEEIAKYYNSEEYISHTDSNKGLVNKMYQTIKAITLKQKLKLINSFSVNKKSLLDIGCGTGDFLKICKTNNWEVFGVEPNMKARELAMLKNQISIAESLDEISNKKFDVITLWHVLEHVPNLEAYINKILNLLQSEGTLVIAVPNYNSFDAKYYKKYWAAFDVPRHRWHFSKKSIELLFSEKAKLIKTKPMWFDSFYISLLSEKYKNGSQNLFKAFFVGLWSNLKGVFTKEYSSHIYVLKKTK